VEFASARPGDKQTAVSCGNPGLNSDSHLPALTGIRFFAIFHIFLFHLWSLYDFDKDPQFENLMIGFAGLPEGLVTFLSHGWMSTSFFFLLSGFILAYLYWREDGELAVTKKRFWAARFARIYPIHILLLLVAIALTAGYVLSQGKSVGFVVASIFANITLMQAWYPPFVPVWSWPTWTVSALVFLYALMPYLMRWFSRLSDTQMKIMLWVLPIVSLIPVVAYARFFPAGSDPGQNWQIFIGSTPVFWLTHFIAGMLLSRVFGISRFNRQWRPAKSSRVSAGDAALLAVVIIACIPGIEEEPLKFYFRQGLMMPLYMITIIDMARHQGIAARLFSLPGIGFLGETGYSIFIWQNLIMGFCWLSLMITPAAGQYQLWVVPIVMVLVAIFSTYAIEKPLSRWIRRKFIPESVVSH
jgi:peptidoglycan/LPS O-acetylase OafA/YrhL